jgi:hypothetical protein
MLSGFRLSTRKYNLRLDQASATRIVMLWTEYTTDVSSFCIGNAGIQPEESFFFFFFFFFGFSTTTQHKDQMINTSPVLNITSTSNILLGIFFTPLSTGNVALSFAALLAYSFSSVYLCPGSQWYLILQFLLYRVLLNFPMLLIIHWPSPMPLSLILGSATIELVKIEAIFLSPIWVQI